MPIVVSCRCGQSYQAPDTLAGKQVKCPSCGQVLTVGAGGAAASAADPLGLGGAGGFGAAPTYGSPSQYAPTTAYQQPTYQTPGYSQPAYSQPAYAQPGLAPGAYGRPGAPARSSGGSKKGLIIGLAIGGGVLGLGLVGVVVLALLLPAVQKAREAAREAAARQQAAGGPEDGGAAATPVVASGGPTGGNIAGGGGGKPDIPASWKKYDSPSEQFSIYFPGNPKHTSKSIPAAGMFLKAQVHQYETPQGVFQIATTEVGDAPQFQGDQLRQILDLGIDEVLKNLRGTSRTKSDVTHQGFQGREFTFDARVGTTQAEGHGRAFLGVGRTYELLWLGAKGKKPSSDVTRFFTSLDITAKPPQPGAGNTAGPGGGIPGLPPGFGSPPGSGIPGGGIPGGGIPGGNIPGGVPGGVPQLPNGINGGPNAGGSPPFPGGSPVPGGSPNAGGSPVPTLPGGVPGGVPGGIPGGPGFPGNGSPPTPGGGPGGPGGFGPGGFRPGGSPTRPGGAGGVPRPR